MIFRVTFLNCYNLFAPEMLVDRSNAPRSSVELTQKIESLSRTIRAASAGQSPEIIALCEVGSEPLGRQIARSLDAGGYDLLWSGIPPAGRAQMGLLLLYNPALFEPVAESLQMSPSAITERSKWMAAQFRLRGGRDAAFWLVVNHWKSKHADWSAGQSLSPFVSPLSEMRQMDSAEEISQLYLEQEHRSTRAMILIGDFNCEPGDKPFQYKKGRNFVGARQRSAVTRLRNSKAYFYNPMWRYLGEPHDLQTAAAAGYQRPLTGTWVGAENRLETAPLFDQLLVSRGLLSGPQIRFIESSLTIVPPETTMSDHCALSAQFERFL